MYASSLSGSRLGELPNLEQLIPLINFLIDRYLKGMPAALPEFYNRVPASDLIRVVTWSVKGTIIRVNATGSALVGAPLLANELTLDLWNDSVTGPVLRKLLIEFQPRYAGNFVADALRTLAGKILNEWNKSPVSPAPAVTAPLVSSDPISTGATYVSSSADSQTGDLLKKYGIYIAVGVILLLLVTKGK